MTGIASASLPLDFMPHAQRSATTEPSAAGLGAVEPSEVSRVAATGPQFGLDSVQENSLPRPGEEDILPELLARADEANKLLFQVLRRRTSPSSDVATLGGDARFLTPITNIEYYTPRGSAQYPSPRGSAASATPKGSANLATPRASANLATPRASANLATPRASGNYAPHSKDSRDATSRETIYHHGRRVDLHTGGRSSCLPAENTLKSQGILPSGRVTDDKIIMSLWDAILTRYKVTELELAVERQDGGTELVRRGHYKRRGSQSSSSSSASLSFHECFSSSSSSSDGTVNGSGGHDSQELSPVRD